MTCTALVHSPRARLAAALGLVVATISILGSGCGRPAPAIPPPLQFSEPTGVAVDARGNVYVADTGNHRIQKLSADGEA